jgi:hypothetical protein
MPLKSATCGRELEAGLRSRPGSNNVTFDGKPLDGVFVMRSTQMCVKDGMKYALAAEKKIYTLEGHEAELAKLAGQKVTLKGTLKGNTLSVQEVAASK